MFTTVSATDVSLAALLAISVTGLWVAAFITAAKIGQASASKWWEKKLRTVPVQASLGSPKDF